MPSMIPEQEEYDYVGTARAGESANGQRNLGDNENACS